MNRSLFNDLAQSAPAQTSAPNPINNFGEFVKNFKEFSSTFTGNPEAQVKQLLSSGRMSQEQFNQYASQANQLRSLIK